MTPCRSLNRHVVGLTLAHSVASAGSSFRLRSRRTSGSYMLKSKDDTNRSLRACGSIVVGSPSLAQRNVFASTATASAASTIIAERAHLQPRRSRLFIIPSRLRSKLAQRFAQRRARVRLAYQAAPLQGRHQPFADLVDEAAAGALERGADQEPVAADLLQRARHLVADVIGRTDQVEIAIKTPGGELPQGLAAAPLLEPVERTLLAIGGQPAGQWLVEIVLREVDVRRRAAGGKRGLDEGRRGDKASVRLPRLPGGLAKGRIDQPQNLDVVGVSPNFRCVSAHVVAIFLHTSNIAARRDDRIGMFRGKSAAA